MRVVVTEYPKSGGTWLTGLLGDALGLPKRDIYIGDGYGAFDASLHPWYRGAASLNVTESCVIKSHEQPGSPLTDFPATFVHLVRDGRDVVVSKYVFEKEFCVRNRILERFEESFDSYVPRVAAEWAAYVGAWLAQGTTMVTYESLLVDTAQTLATVLSRVGLSASEAAIAHAVAANTKQKLHESLAAAFAHNTFVRKGVAGDWRNHLEARQADAFKRAAGAMLIRLGYESDACW
jgi:hypothetical protein